MSPAAFIKKKQYLYLSEILAYRMRKGIIFIVALWSLFSCGRGYKEVDAAEEQMMQAPDSALTLMQSIMADDLPTRGLRARHALLFTMAKNKCYQDISADTTIRMSYQWYQHHGSKRYKMLSSYYLGFVEQDRGNNMEALLAFKTAESIADNLNDYRQLSLIEQHLSEIFKQYYDNVQSLDYSQKALSYAKMARDSVMEDYCTYDVALRLFSLGRYQEAEEFLEHVLQKSKNNPSLYSYAARIMAEIYLLKDNPDYESAESYYQEIEGLGVMPFYAHDYGIIATISECENRSEEADAFLATAESMLRSPVDSIVFYNDCRNVYDVRKDWEKAHEFKTKSVKIQDRIVIQLLGHSLTHAMENYYEDEWKLEKAKSQVRLSLSILIGVLFLILASVASFSVIRRRQVLLEDMARTQDLSNDMMNTFVADKIKSLQALSESYFAWEDTSVKKREERIGKQTRDEIITTFRGQLSDLRNDKTFISALEQSLNLTENGIMDRLRKCLLSEKELDFSILTLLFSGFSIKSISFLLRMSEASLRMRKSRYKKLFEEFTEPDRSRFLEKMG